MTRILTAALLAAALTTPSLAYGPYKLELQLDGPLAGAGAEATAAVADHPPADGRAPEAETE